MAVAVVAIVVPSVVAFCSSFFIDASRKTSRVFLISTWSMAIHYIGFC